MSDYVFASSGIAVSYGGVRALDGVDLNVIEGQLVGLIGPNGAGKTTFIDAVTGFVGCAGKVLLDDTDISSFPPHERARRGLVRTWQSIELFHELTVGKNLIVAARRPTLRGTLLEMVRGPARHADVREALAQVGLEWAEDLMPDVLSLGQRKLVGVARALVRKPRLLCLDEPAAGLDRTESDEFGRRLRALADAGQSMLLIDHDMGLVLTICDLLVVLNFGTVIAMGTPAEVVRDERVLSAYLGSSATALEREETTAAARPDSH
jgi:branched-chain amino acid transport system ATP-binding protein